MEEPVKLTDDREDMYNFINFLSNFFKKNKTSWGKRELVLKLNELGMWWLRKKESGKDCEKQG